MRKARVVASSHFGIMSKEEFRRAVKQIEKEVSDAVVPEPYLSSPYLPTADMPLLYLTALWLSGHGIFFA